MSLKSMIPWSRTERDLPVRRDVESPLSLFQHDMNRLFAEFFGDWALSPFGMDTAAERWARVDWEEKEKEVVVSAELPGVEEKDIEVSIDRDVLTLRAEKKSETETQEGEIRGRERRYGSFHRTLTLGMEVDPEKVKAVYKNGVLRVTLPKKESAKTATRKIEVKAA